MLNLSILAQQGQVFDSYAKANQLFNSKDGEMNYLAPYLFLKNSAIEEKNSGHSSLKTQLQYEFHSFLHLSDKIDKPLFPKPTITDPEISYKDARPIIMEQATTHKVVMFNEEHHTPLHRLYVQTFLKGLKKQGFTVLALETLNDEDTELNTRKYPISSTGHYTKEPYFANLVRKALELGYRVLPYESRDTLDFSIKTRERNQSDNLAKIIKKGKEKVLVLAGYSHIAEEPIESGHGGVNEWMAYLLNKNHGINPLTIDQTTISKSNRLEIVSIPYKNKKLYALKELGNGYDISLAYPTNLEYLHRELGKKKVEIHLNEKHLNNALLQIYVHQEYITQENKAIPYEQFLVDSVDMNIYLAPEKEYLMIVRDMDYKVIFKRKVNI